MAKPISFASFNLYNFQKVGGYVYGNKVEQDDYDAKLEWTRTMIGKIDTDVIAFQELWNKECLEDVFSINQLSEYQLHFVDPNIWTKNIAVALAVKSPWKVEGEVETIKKFPFDQLVKTDAGDGEDDQMELTIDEFSRSVLKARIKHDSSNTTPGIDVFACHFKSKLPTRNVTGFDNKYKDVIGGALSTIRRTAEAAALKMILIDQMKGTKTPTVVLGDLNDDPASNTLSLITGQPKMTKSSTGGDDSLYSCLYLQQLQSFNNVYYTHEYKNHKGVLDHILVSEEFFENSPDAKWSHQVTKIWNDYMEDGDKSTSDHGIIKAIFK